MTRIAEVDFDEATYLGSSNDGVYFDATEKDGKWYLGAVVDCNSAGFTEPIVNDDGPYETRNEAMQGGLNAAYEWLVTNEIRGWRTDYRKLARKYK